MLNKSNEILRQSFQEIWLGTVNFLPKILVAFVIFVIGWLIGSALSSLIERVSKAIKLDNVLKSAKIDLFLEKAGFRLNSGVFLGGLVKWFIIVSFLVASFDVLGLDQVNRFLQNVVLDYLPQVIVAVLILLVAAVIAETMKKIVVGAARAGGITSANFLGGITKWAILIFAGLSALFQLGIAAAFVQTLFTGVVVSLSLAFGLAFGLGGQEAAAKLIDKIKSTIKGD
jgi:small-conductance mechanosensitive channel